MNAPATLVAFDTTSRESNLAPIESVRRAACRVCVT